MALGKKFIMRKTEKIPVSVCIIAYNEEAKIRGCLNSVRLFDDVVVLIDAKTTDKTAGIARDFGCRVFVEEWKGDGPQKQSAIDKGNNDWVLLLDADERVAADSVLIIKEHLRREKSVEAYSFKRRSYIGDRIIRHSGWWPDRVTRLFDKKMCRMRGITHSSLEVNGKTILLDAVIEHYSYTDYSHLISKMNTYSSWMANELYANNNRINFFTPLTHALWMFLRTFIIKRGFMDGLDGLAISVANSSGSFFKYAKLLELQRQRNK